jgi:predicted DNA-binding protein with PD1-like motif
MAEPESAHDRPEAAPTPVPEKRAPADQSAAQSSAIGVLSRVDLNCLDGMRKYERIPVNERVGVAALLADVVLSPEDERALHLHFVADRRNGTALAGQRKQVRHER